MPIQQAAHVRGAVVLIAVLATLVVAGCGNPDGPATPASGNSNSPAKPGTSTITRADLEEAGKQWPFTVDTATLTCENDAVTANINGTVYALNGTAKSRKAGADPAPVWAENPDMPGLRINIGDVIDLGLKLC